MERDRRREELGLSVSGCGRASCRMGSGLVVHQVGVFGLEGVWLDV